MSSHLFTYAVGDVHGDHALLTTLLDRIHDHADGEDYRLVFLGNAIDHGPNGAAVLSALRAMELRAPDRVVALRGWHEAMMAEAEHDKEALALWLRHGGDATLRSFQATRLQEVPREVVDWVARRPAEWRDALRRYVGGPELAEDDAAPGLHVVHGALPVRPTGDRLLPDVRPGVTCIDTGAGFGGPLTAAVFTDLQAEPVGFFQAQEDGSCLFVPPRLPTPLGRDPRLALRHADGEPETAADWSIRQDSELLEARLAAKRRQARRRQLMATAAGLVLLLGGAAVLWRPALRLVSAPQATHWPLAGQDASAPMARSTDLASLAPLAPAADTPTPPGQPSPAPLAAEPAKPADGPASETAAIAPAPSAPPDAAAHVQETGPQRAHALPSAAEAFASKEPTAATVDAPPSAPPVETTIADVAPAAPPLMAHALPTPEPAPVLPPELTPAPAPAPESKAEASPTQPVAEPGRVAEAERPLAPLLPPLPEAPAAIASASPPAQSAPLADEPAPRNEAKAETPPADAPSAGEPSAVAALNLVPQPDPAPQAGPQDAMPAGSPPQAAETPATPDPDTTAAFGATPVKPAEAPTAPVATEPPPLATAMLTPGDTPSVSPPLAAGQPVQDQAAQEKGSPELAGQEAGAEPAAPQPPLFALSTTLSLVLDPTRQLGWRSGATGEETGAPRPTFAALPAMSTPELLDDAAPPFVAALPRSAAAPHADGHGAAPRAMARPVAKPVAAIRRPPARALPPAARQEQAQAGGPIDLRAQQPKPPAARGRAPIPSPASGQLY